MNSVELVVVGGGPAGLTAGIYAARAGLSLVVLEALRAGGSMGENAFIENYPGFPDGLPGLQLAEKFVQQAARNGVSIHEMEPVEDLRASGDGFVVKTNAEVYSARSVILATGTRRRRLSVPGEEPLLGRGVSYCATCDGPLFKNRRVAVVGGGNTAVSDALFLSNIASSVILIHRRDQLRAERALQDLLFKRANVKFLWNSVVTKVIGREKVDGVEVRDQRTGETALVEVDGVFVAVGETPNSELAKRVGAELTEEGYVKVNPLTMETSVPGVFAAGDLTGVFNQVAVAVGQGAVAAKSAYERVKGASAKSRSAR